MMQLCEFRLSCSIRFAVEQKLVEVHRIVAAKDKFLDDGGSWAARNQREV